MNAWQILGSFGLLAFIIFTYTHNNFLTRKFLSNFSRWSFLFVKHKWTFLTQSTTHSTGNFKTPIVILVLSYFSSAFSFVPQFITKLYPYCLSTPSHFILTLICHNTTTLIEAQISIERSISPFCLFTPQ